VFVRGAFDLDVHVLDLKKMKWFIMEKEMIGW
jgi:hypothetical protein